MKLCRVAAGALNQTPLDWQRNKDNIVAAIAAARRDRASLLCLPELCISGYGCEDAFFMPSVVTRAWDTLESIRPQTEGMIVSVGLPVSYRASLFSAACLLVDGRVAGLVAKQSLAGDGIHYEPRWFRPWPRGAVASYLAPDGQAIPFGDLLFDVGGVRIGFEICEDAWVSNRAGIELAALGVDVIINPSASHFAFHKIETRKRFVAEGSRAFFCSYVYANLLGNEAGRAIYDGGVLIASGGELVALGPRFSFQDVSVCTATIDVDLTRTQRARSGSFCPNLLGEQQRTVGVPFAYPDPVDPRPSVLRTVACDDAWENGPFLKEEEFTRALSLALWDYLRKSRSRGFVVSLSGGADSATVACLVYLMVRLSLTELGIERWHHRLTHIFASRPNPDPKTLVHTLLTTLYQATENSGDVTQNAAREVAAAVGATHMEINVDAIVKAYVTIASMELGRPLTWNDDDTALQNIQARARSPSAWLIANVKGALLLSTSNRSEASVGYATMDGDTSGGLCPLGGIDKPFVLRWLAWMVQHGPSGCGPIPELVCVTRQTPTAELRPRALEQTDEGDLMPYPILDAIERAAILDKRSPIEAFIAIRAQFPDVETRKLGGFVARFYRLWAQNQWKRERYAPSFHLDDANVDPKTWCRFPILSGGFDAELSELDAFIDRQVLAASTQTGPDQ